MSMLFSDPQLTNFQFFLFFTGRSLFRRHLAGWSMGRGWIRGQQRAYLEHQQCRTTLRTAGT